MNYVVDSESFGVMERDRYLRRATLSAVNGLSRRRQRITNFRDSTDQGRQMDLQETDRQQLLKEREREFPKRRRVSRSTVQQRSDGSESYRENESTDSSDEEYYEEEEETRIHQQNRTNQLSPGSCSLSNNRRGLRTLRSTPVLRAASDEMFGVPIPRRARSYSVKRFHDYSNSGSGGFGEDLSHRRSSPATVSLIGPGVSMKKKMKSVERTASVLSSTSNHKPSVIEDDIEIEVAEALFDLMKQSQSQPQSSLRQGKVDRDGINTAIDELKMLKADGCKDENNAFSVQNEPSIKVKADLSLADPVKEMKREGRIENESKFPDDQAQELVNGDGFVNKVKVGSPKGNESLSCVKVNACDIQDPTVIKAHDEAIITEAKKETKLEIDLMALPPLPSSPERDALFDKETDPEVTNQVVQKKSETISKNGPLAVAIGMQEEKAGVVNSNQIRMEKHIRHDGIFSVSSGASQPQQGRKEPKNLSATSLLPFPIGTSSWPGVLPHTGYMPPPQAVLPTSGSAKPSIIMQPPQFKFWQPGPNRCATHKFVAHSIHCHQELIKKSLSSGSTGPGALYGTKYSNSNYMLPPQNLTPGNPLAGHYQGGQNLGTVAVGSAKDKSFDANDTTNGKSVLQNDAPASNFLRGPGFIFPLGHHQTTMTAPANSSSQSASAVGNASLPSNSAGRCSGNLPLPAASASMSLNHPIFSSNEATQYMAILQNNGCPFPTSTNIVVPPFRGGIPSVPLFNPSLSPLFNVSQNQQQLAIPHTPVQSTSQTTNSSSHKHLQFPKQTSGKISKFPIPLSVNPQQSDKSFQLSHLSSKYDTNISQKSCTSVANGLASHSVKPSNSQTCLLSGPPMNLGMSTPVSVGSGGDGNKHIDAPEQGFKDRDELIPQAFALSFGPSASAAPALSFSSMAQNSAMFHMLPDMSWNGNQMVHQKNFQASEGKSITTGGQSFNFSKSDCKEMSALATMGPPKFDGLARTINFLPSSLTGNQPFQTSSAALSSGVSVTVPNFQQHQRQPQLIQVQNPQMMQLQLAGTAQVQSSTPNSISGSFLTSIFPSDRPVLMQVSFPNDNSSFPPNCENFHKITNSEGLSQSATSGLVNLPQLSSQGGTLCFGNSTISAASSQEHKIVAKSEPVSSLMVGLSSNSSILRNMGISQRTASAVGTAPHEAEASPVGTSQKSSPSCRRNVPSILSTCPSQLPELKY